MDVKEASTGDGKSHFIFVVGMFLVELLEHGIQIWGFRRDVDDVGGNEAAFDFEAIDLGSVGAENILIARVGGESSFDFPVFVPNPERFEEGADGIDVGEGLFLIGDDDLSHGSILLWGNQDIVTGGVSVGEVGVAVRRTLADATGWDGGGGRP